MIHPPLPFDESGAGQPLVLLHAFPFDRRFWHGVSPGFATAGFRVVAPDLKGFGQAHIAESGAQEAWSLLDQARSVVALLDHLQIAQAHVLGLSMGGYIALALAAEYPQRLLSLVLVNTRAAADSPQAQQARTESMAAIRHAGPEPFLDALVSKMLAPASDTSRRQHTRALMDQPKSTLLLALAALRDRPDRSALLPDIRVPTLVMTGAHDAIAPSAESREMAAKVPGARFVEIPVAGHLSNLEAPESFVDAVGSFLKAQP